MRSGVEAAVISACLAGLAIAIALSQWMWRWDMAIYDWHISAWTRPPPGDILIVAIDDESIAELGQWPWPRRQYVDFVRKMTDGGANVIALALDVSVADVADPESDAMLAQAVAENGRLVLPVTVGRLRQGGQAVEVLPIPLLTDAAARLGQVDIDVDSDGFARTVPLYAGLGPTPWPTLALAMLQVADSEAWPAREVVAARSDSVSAETSFFWRRHQKVLVPFAGPSGHFVQISFADVIRDGVPLSVFKDKFVFLGITASGTGDAFLIPSADGGTLLSGVEFAANVLDTLRRDLTISRTTTVQTIVVTSILTFSMVMLYIVRSARWIYLVFGIVAILSINVTTLRMARVWFDPMPPLVAFLSAVPVVHWRRRHAESHRRFEESQRAQVTLQSIADGVITTDLQGDINYMNTVAERLTGYRASAARDLPLLSVFRVVDEDQHNVIDPIDQVSVHKSGIDPMRDAILIGRTGRRHFIRLSVASLKSLRGKVSGYVITFSDATDVRLLTKVLEHQSTHDPLTRLPNRLLFHDRFSHAIATARRENRLAAVILIRLDIAADHGGEPLGQQAREGALKAVGSRLDAARREVDIVARLGDDEFAVLLESVPDDQAVVALAFRLLGKVETPLVLDDQKIAFQICAGVSIFPNDGDSIESLLGNADRARIKAQDQSENCVWFHGEHLNVRHALDVDFDPLLESALNANDLEIVFEPILSVKTNDVVGAGALSRWPGALPPVPSLYPAHPTSDGAGFYVPLGKWAFDAVMLHAAHWQNHGLPDTRVALPLFHRELVDIDLVRIIETALHTSELRADSLCLEIAESAIIKDANHAITMMHALKALGVRLAIHGFGSSYSSISHLKRFPIDYIKIEPSLVQAATRGDDEAAVIHAIASMARELRLMVVAAGVETEAQLALVRNAGCEQVQGSVFGQPLRAEEILTWVMPPLMQEVPSRRTKPH